MNNVVKEKNTETVKLEKNSIVTGIRARPLASKGYFQQWRESSFQSLLLRKFQSQSINSSLLLVVPERHPAVPL